jgi:L-malate glycosyltransferase
MVPLNTRVSLNGRPARAGAAPAGRANPVRVGFVVHVMQVAGAEVLVAEAVRRLAGRIEPVVFCLDAVGALGDQLLAQGVPVVCLGRRPGRDWRVGWRLAGELRARRVEVVHAHQYSPFFYAALARAVMARPPRLILTEHGRHYPDVVSPLRRAANRLVLDRLADAVNACCRFSGRALARVDGFAGERIEVIANGIEVERYGTAADRTALRRSLGLDPARRYVICVARFHPIKDHAMLLRAFAPVAAARADVDLLLAGDGPLRGDRERQARALGLEGRVRFLGVRADVPALLEAADVFALTSISEAASLTILEAMASRLPVVVTAVGGNPEIVRQGVDGLLVPRGDDGAASAALARLLDDPVSAKAMGAAGRARVEERYRLGDTIENYARLYERLCKRRG